MKRFQAKWDNCFESLAIRLDQCQSCSKVRTLVESNALLSRMRGYVNRRLPWMNSFIAKCTNGQAPVLTLRGRDYVMSYQARRFLVYSLASLPMMFNRKGFVRRYALWSVLFLRETFNPRYYKFNPNNPFKTGADRKL